MYDFAERLKTIRKKQGLTQQNLASTIGVTKAAISSMERGLTNAPTPGHLFKLANALNCDPISLLLGDNAKPITKQVQNKHNLSNDEANLLNSYSRLSEKQRHALFDYLQTLSSD